MNDNYKWLNCIPDGWVELARKMIQECEAIDPTYYIIDLKEKWGTLCVTSISECNNNEIYTIEEKYESLSGDICCKCGAPAEWYSTGWILPFCDKHIDKNKLQFYKQMNPLFT